MQQRRALRHQMKGSPPPDKEVTAFLEAFYFFEGVVRTIGRYYRSRSGSAPRSDGHESLNRDVVGRSLKYFGILLSSETLDLLLSSEFKKRGSKSARNLRNAVAHTWAKEDQAEICDRFVQLDRALKMAIGAIKKATMY